MLAFTPTRRPVRRLTMPKALRRVTSPEFETKDDLL